MYVPESDLDGFEALMTVLPERHAHRVRTAMAEPQRVYHAAWHLGRMWNLHVRHGEADDLTVALMIAWHDIVYDTRAGNPANETNSAMAFLEQTAHEDFSPSMRHSVASAILASADHLRMRDGLDAAGQWFLDLDLEPMASTDFDRNTDFLRREFNHIPEEIFNRNRLKFLQGMLEGPTIFSPHAPKSWEQDARDNIARALDTACAPWV